jgi:ribonuclease Z
MSTVKPRLAIGYHFFNEEATRFGIYDGVRETYDGPLTLAVDNMVWNVTKDKIVERMTISPDQAWAVLGTKRLPSPEKGLPDPVTDAIKAGAWDVKDAQGAMIEAFKKEHSLK